MEGTYECPWCGDEKPHHHGQRELNLLHRAQIIGMNHVLKKLRDIIATDRSSSSLHGKASIESEFPALEKFVWEYTLQNEPKSQLQVKPP